MKVHALMTGIPAIVIITQLKSIQEDFLKLSKT